MKELGNLSLLALLAVGLALVFGGCRSDVGGILAIMGAMDQEDSGTENPSEPGDETPEPEREYLSLENSWDLSSGYNSSYDEATKTITWSDAYGGRGWWFGSGDNGKDASAYTKFTVVFSNASGEDPWLKLVVEYADGSESVTEGVFNADGFKLTVGLDSSNKSSIKQAYIVGKAAGNTATIKEAYFE